jgi:hypothetical protein
MLLHLLSAPDEPMLEELLMVNETLAQAIRDALVEEQLPCAEAFRIAEELKVAPAEVGRAADELGVRVSRCQLGLFGHGPKAAGRHRIVQPLAVVPPRLSEEMRIRLKEGRLPCAAAWAAAKRSGMARLEVSGAAETLQIRISCCQLGCF